MNEQNYQISTDELRVVDARIAIASRVGLNRNPRSGLGKRDLNSIYAFLTGEFLFDKREYGTSESPSLRACRIAVADEAGIDSYDEYSSGRPFRLDELVELVRTLEAHRDQRWRPK